MHEQRIFILSLENIFFEKVEDIARKARSAAINRESGDTELFDILKFLN